METLTDPCEAGDSLSSAATAAAAEGTMFPSWAMLNLFGYSRDTSVADDPRTVAASFTSTGRSFRVSFGVAPPPATSCLYYKHDWAGGAPGYDEHIEQPKVIATHGDSVLFQTWPPKPKSPSGVNTVFDNFLYVAGAGRRPPAMLLLPSRPAKFPMQFERDQSRSHPACRALRKESTGLLRRGDDDGFLVAQLEVKPAARDAPRDTAELCVLHSGSREWELKRAVPIVHGEPTTEELMRWWETDAVVPVGDRFLCFVDYFRGFLLWDDDEDRATAMLRYVALPVEVPKGCPNDYDGGRPCQRRSRNMCDAGADTVRFVSVESRCCCGGPGRTSCDGGRFAFTVTTWVLSLMMDNPAAATWVKNRVLDCDELWALPAYGVLPRVTVEYPIVSLDNPDVVCFTVCEDRWVISPDKKVWMLMVDMRSKTLLSVIRCTTEAWRAESHFPVKLQW